MYNRNNFCNTGTGRQMQPSRPQFQSNAGVYGHQQRTPMAVGYARANGGMMNSESNWSLQHHDFKPNQSTSSFNPGKRNIVYNAVPSKLHQTCSTFQGGNTFQQMPQPQMFYRSPFQAQNFQSSVPIAKISLPESQPGQVVTGNLPSEFQNNPNVNYVSLNWEDILGGKGGLGGLQVSMAPSNSGNPNRQIRIGMAGDQSTSDGSTPLKIVSFQPLENYPGKMNPTTMQNQFKTNFQMPKFQTGTWGQSGTQQQTCTSYQIPKNFGQNRPKPGNGSYSTCQLRPPYASRR